MYYSIYVLIEINKNKYESFINYDGKIYKNFEDYITYMKLNQNWGDNLEIQAFFDMFTINVHVHVLNNKDLILVNEDSNEDNWLHLYFNGINHYNILIKR